MKHTYLIILKFAEWEITMPYIFTTLKEACAYGEYKYRKTYNMISYEIEKAIVFNSRHKQFYKL